MQTRVGIVVGRVLAVLGVAAAAVVAPGTPASAHTPHDQVSAVAVSPGFERDHTVLVASGNRVLRSTDGGSSWSPIVRGLPRTSEEGKPLSSLAFAPGDERVAYLSSRGDGVFRSTDGGTSWRPASQGLTDPKVAQVVVSPRSPETVLAAAAIYGVSRSDDGGRTWAAAGRFANVQGMAFLPGPRGGAVLGDAQGNISVSPDDGRTWTQTTTTGGRGGVTAVAAAVDGPGTAVFVGTAQGGLLRSLDGGRTFAPLGAGLPEDQIRALAPSPAYATDHTLLASTWGQGTYRSTDGGATWDRQADGLTTDEQADRLELPQFGALAQGGAADGDPVAFLAGFDGLFRSTDGGARWTSIETLTEYVVGLAVSPDYATDGTVVVTTYVKGAYRSTDRGATWAFVDQGLEHALSEGNKFAPVKRLHNVVFSPDYATDRTIFSATWDHFLRSTDGGASWSQIAVTAGAASTVLRQFVIAVSPDYHRDHTVLLGTRQGDIFRSTDRGAPGSWARVSTTRSPVRSIVITPGPAAGQVLFAGTDAGVVTSTDHGATWVRTGPPGTALLAISPAFARDATILAGTDDGLFASIDRGGNWLRLSDPALRAPSRVEALALSPDYGRDGTILVSLGGRGLYRSTDRGKTFDAIALQLAATEDIIADFSNPTSEPIQFSPSYARDRTVFAFAGPHVLRSTDGGESWRRLALPSATAFLAHADAATSPTTAAPTRAPAGSAPGADGSGDAGGTTTALAVGAAAAALAGAGALVLGRRRRARAAQGPR